MKKDIYHQPYFPFLLVGSYLSYCYGVIGLRGDHIAMGVLIFGLWYAHPKARQWLLAFLPFLLNWVAYDMMRAFPNYLFNTVHIADLYAAEKALFGINLDGVRLTPCEFFAIYHHPIFDALGGLFYLSWVPVPMGIAAYLWWQNEAAFRRFIVIFLLTNFIGYIGYYAYPAAPPWYIALHGTEFIANTPAFPAALTRFDSCLDCPYLAICIVWGLTYLRLCPRCTVPALWQPFCLVGTISTAFGGAYAYCRLVWAFGFRRYTSITTMY
ncbi:MAG: phosphatase PAP2 family protein [Sphingobacteriales bacterium]|nr:phosphatase PAP2 family protein [Sphingobacteriales bacterium]